MAKYFSFKDMYLVPKQSSRMNSYNSYTIDVFWIKFYGIYIIFLYIDYCGISMNIIS